MKSKITQFIIIFLAIVLLLPSFAFASSTNGTIDSTYKYAWSENTGWINFGASGGNVAITDSGMTGYAWSANYGWINLNPSGSGVSNNGEGILSGSAWGENTGWINFSGVTIDSSGYFSGYALGDITGQVSFNCSNTSSCGSSDFKVRTDWRPQSARNNSTGDAGGRRTTSSSYIPTITSNGGESEAQIFVNANETFVTTVQAKSSRGILRYSIYGGDDKDLFEINDESGELNFKDPPAYQNPTDKNKDNIYEIVVEVENTSYSSSSSNRQTLYIEVISESLSVSECDGVEGFIDTEGHWAEAYIEDIYNKGIVDGRDECHYVPNDYVTRAELVKMSLGMIGEEVLDTVSVTSFVDVDLSTWYAPYVEAAKEKGIVGGYGDQTFRPGNFINRAEALKIVLEAIIDGDVESDYNTEFRDVFEGEWYMRYINYAVEHDIVSGYGDGTFGPSNYITRAEIAKIISLILD